MITPGVFCALVFALSPSDEPTVDKSQYNLFNPTPAALMREMTTDRPDTTESPFTVDAGHLQIELSFVEYLRDGRADSYSVMPTNFRLGVLENLEFALVVSPFIHAESPSDDASGTFTSDSGFGDLELRAKINLWGNDDGRTALALMPFISFPTAADNLGSEQIEGGLIVPFAMALDDVWNLGLMAEFDLVHDADRDAYDLDFVHTATIGRDLFGPLGGYLEYIGSISTAPSSPYLALLGVGLTYAINDNWQLDAGINIGLNDAADDLNPFIGMAIRF